MSRRETGDAPVVASRRRLLELVSGAAVAGVAGCGGDGGETNTPTDTPTEEPTGTPAEEPTGTPAEEPTGTSTDAPTDTATATPVTEPPPWDPGVVRTMSFNVRYDDPDDDNPDGEPPWPDRRERVVGAIRDVDPDIVGLQEALPYQFSYVREQLNGYEWYGIGRQGDDDGEHVPLGWRTDRFEAIETDTFWLSETPDVPGSVGWDASFPRITGRVDLENRETGTRLQAYNTHLSHVGNEARHNSSRMIRERVEDQVVDGRMCTVLGDFNFTPGSDPYAELTRSALVDSRTVAATVDGPEGTFHGWTGNPGQRIDHVFLPIDVAVDRYRTLPPGENGAYRSDHLPVVADIDRDGIESTFG